MKKITLLLMLFVASIGLNAQTWEFNNSKDGWVPVKADQVKVENFWQLTSQNGEKNPGLRLKDSDELAKIDVKAVHVIAITLKNKSTNGPDEIKVVITTEGDDASGIIRAYSGMSTGDTDFKTYYIDLSHNRWVGSVSDIKINFVKMHNKDFTGTGTEVFEIDKIEMLDAIPTTEKNVYSFKTDKEGFTTKNSNLEWVEGKLIFTPKEDAYAKMQQDVHHVDADNNKTLTIRLKNKSLKNNQLRFIHKNDSGENLSVSKTISVGDSKEQTYQFDLSADASWTGNKTFERKGDR